MKTVKELIEMVLENTYLMSLATVSDAGPWVSDVVFVHDKDFKIYWLSKPDTRHSESIMKDARVAASITLSTGQGEDNVGIQIEGTAQKIKGDVFKMAVKHLLKRKKLPPMKLGEILKSGQYWYCLTPTNIEVIYEPYWGFTKQKFNVPADC